MNLLEMEQGREPVLEDQSLRGLGPLLQRLITSPSKIAVIHSSLPNLRPTGDRFRWELIQEIKALGEAGYTIVLPAFTFTFCQGIPFNRSQGNSETGVLADWVMALRGAIRTRHPIYSFVAYGPLARELLTCGTESAFGDDSPFCYFEHKRATVIMFGCGWNYCTQFHRYEEEAKVPYRFFKRFDGSIFDAGVQQPVTTEFYARNLQIDARNDFSSAVRQLNDTDAIRSEVFRGSCIEAVDCADLAGVARKFLADDAWCFVLDPNRTKYRYLKLQQALKTEPLRIALLGSSNVEHIKQYLVASLTKLVPDRHIELFTIDFDQFLPESLNPDSTFSRTTFHSIFIVDRLEDLMGSLLLESLNPDSVKEKCALFVAAVEKIAKSRSCHLFLFTFSRLTRSPFGMAPRTDSDDMAPLVARVNAALSRVAEQRASTTLVSLERLVLEYGHTTLLDERLWFLGRFPYSQDFSNYLAQRMAGLQIAALGRGARLLVLDLDHTLWGGVLGEEGIKGLKLGGDFPGNCFLHFQQLLKVLTKRGLLLAIASKNDETLALAAIDSLPFMALRADSFVTHRINWQPKWRNVQDICSELNLGLESVLFVDDNPVERALMAQNLPEVKVLEMPQDVSFYAQALLSSPWLETILYTKEDSARLETYRARKEIKEQEVKFEDMASFYSSLQLKLHTIPLDDTNLVRSEQLFSKTNQFNTTTRRYSAAELEAMRAEGHDVVALGLEDQFSPFEIIGMLVAKYGQPDSDSVYVDSYLLSCRVLGRGIEVGAIQWLLNRSYLKGYKTVVGDVIETDRNTPVRDVFGSSGFSKSTVPGRWLHPLNQIPSPLPKWITLIDHFAEKSS